MTYHRHGVASGNSPPLKVRDGSEYEGYERFTKTLIGVPKMR